MCHYLFISPPPPVSSPVLLTANTCTTPSAAYACSGGATTGSVGACTAITCANDYSGTPSTPVCSTQGGTWAFTGACVGECCQRTEGTCLWLNGDFVEWGFRWGLPLNTTVYRSPGRALVC